MSTIKLSLMTSSSYLRLQPQNSDEPNMYRISLVQLCPMCYNYKTARYTKAGTLATYDYLHKPDLRRGKSIDTGSSRQISVGTTL